MKPRTLLILLALSLAFFAFIYFFERELPSTAEREVQSKQVLPIDADDVTQSVFRTFFDGVRRAAYDAPDGGEIWALLVALALNKVRNLVEHHTAVKRDVRITLAPDADPAAIVEQDESAADFLRLVVAEQMESLPEASREIVRLRIEGFEVGEIVARTGRSARTVERVLQRFRSLLSEP